MLLIVIDQGYFVYSTVRQRRPNVYTEYIAFQNSDNSRDACQMTR